MAPRQKPATIAYPCATNCNSWHLRRPSQSSRYRGAIHQRLQLGYQWHSGLGPGLSEGRRARRRPERAVSAAGEADALQRNGIYSAISSARASSEGDTVIPSVLAVLRLMTSSYLVGACMG